MIPTELQRGLKKRAEEIFQDIKINSPTEERISLSVFEQKLPQKKSADSTPFPFLIIRILEGELSGNQSHTSNIGFFVGTHDASEDNQGYRDNLMIINKLMENLLKNPIVEGRFELKGPIKWAMHDEGTDPYYFAGLETTWNLPSFSREDVNQFL